MMTPSSYKQPTIIALTVLLALSTLFGGPAALSQSSQVTNGVNYLKSTQNADGSWGGTPTSLNDPFPTTTTALDALKALELSVSTNQTNAINFLTSRTVDENRFMAARITALNGTTSNIATDLNTLLGRQNSDGGWGASDGFESNPLDTSIVLLALKAANVTDSSVLLSALNYLINAQNQDGGWSLTAGENSQVFYTAYALQALNTFNLQFTGSDSQARAVAYLHSKQNSTDGGYGNPASTPFETAVSLQAILGAGLPLTPAEASATNFLNHSQLSDGSWADDAYSTALALRALTFKRNSGGDGNPPPVITSQPVTQGIVGQLYTYQVQANDADGDTLSFSLLQSPDGMTISSSGLVQWTPTAAQAGTSSVTIKVSDGKGSSTLQEYVVMVLAIGVDLTVAGVNTSAMTIDTQTLVVGGTVRVDIQNKGGSDLNGSFDVLLFEDSNHNGTYEGGVDNVLGRDRFSGSIASNGVVPFNVRVSGVVRFRDNLVYAFVDSSNEIPELDETNNIGSSGTSSKYHPPAGDFLPKVKWQWDASDGSLGVFQTPMVAPLIDTNNDGVINERDVPAVIFAPNYPYPQLYNRPTALRGDTGEPIFISVAKQTGGPFLDSGEHDFAIGDIDGDGKPAIIAHTLDFNGSGGLLCFNSDGTLRWKSPSVTYRTQPVIADLDGNGKATILHGTSAFNSDGTIRWDNGRKRPGYVGGPYQPDASQQVADLNLDGKQEIIAGPSALDKDGKLLWWWDLVDNFNGTFTHTGHFDGGATTTTITSNIYLGDTWTAVANLDNDPYPEVIAVSQGGGNDPISSIWIFAHDGRLKAGPFPLFQSRLNQTRYYVGPPTVADFDGDGLPEIAVPVSVFSPGGQNAGGYKGVISVYKYHSSDQTLSTMWQKDFVNTGPQFPWPASAFDFDGDGAAELLYLDEQKFYILNGKDGKTLFEMGVRNTVFPGYRRYPTIADVDNDGVAEVVIPAESNQPDGSPPRHGVLVIGDTKGNWRNARRVWNQWNYSITNINEDGSVPRVPKNNFQSFNNQRTQSHIDGLDPFAAPDLSVSKVTINTQSCPAALGITARIGNGGSLHVGKGITVNYYNGDPASGGTLIGTKQTTKAIYPGEFEDVTLSWNGLAAGQVFVTVNDPPKSSLVQSSNLSLLPNSWAQGSGACSGGCSVVYNFKAYYGIDGNSNTAWQEAPFGTLTRTGPSFYEVHFPFPVNASSVTVQNQGGSSTNSGFLAGTLSFSNGFSAPMTLDADGEGTVTFPEQQNVSWVRLTASSTKTNGASVSEFIVGGSYTEPQFRINEGEGRLANNKAASAPFTAPCDSSVNHPPQITSAPVINGSIGVAYSYQVQAVDPDHDQLSFSLPAAPAGMTITAGGLITWTPTNAQTADSPVTVQVSDGRNGTAQQSFTIHIVPPVSASRPPQIFSQPPTSVTVGQTYQYNVVAYDPDGNPLVYSLTKSPAGATIEQYTGRLSWTPDLSQLGSQSFTVQAQDSRGGIVQQSFAVAVKISPDTLPANAVSCSVVSDKRSYSSNSLAQLTIKIQNLSSDLSILNSQAQLSVTDPAGHSVLKNTLPVNPLAPSGLYQATIGFNTVTNPPGAYQASLNLGYGQQVACQSQASFTVLSSAVHGDALTGSITATPALIETGQSTNFNYQVKNVGNVDLTPVDLKLLLVDTASGMITQTLTDQTALKGGDSFTNSKAFSSTGLKGGDYLLILQGESGGISQTVASTPLRVNSSTLHLSSTNYTVTEGCRAATITVTRTGDTSQPATVDYATGDGTATQRSDYTLTAGTLSFGAGEVSKGFTVLVNEDAYQKGDETVTITLSNAGAGAGIGTESSATLTITDSDAVQPGTNPIDDTGEFVCQHYHDFLSREADPGGAAYWSGEINKCGTDVACILGRRVGVSAAYFTSLEFQQSGYYVYRLYKAGLGRQPTYAEFMPDRSRVVGGADLEANKVAFADQFIARTTFTQQYPNSMTAEQYVDSLNSNTGGAVAQADRDVLVAGLKSGAETRATVLRKVADNQAFQQSEYNGAFVLMQYFGYLRRDPDADGYQFWLKVMNGLDPSAFRGMTCSFITSREYQERFSAVATHSNVDCGNAR